jgi:3-oxoacyl-[acyl-carrier protein] reductase
LINNAGFKKDIIMAWMTSAEWSDVLKVNLDGFFHVTKPVLNSMLRKKEGRIITIVSTSGQSGMPGQANYSAAKAGLIGATKALAIEVARRNILVNAVSPGFIETDMVQELPKDKILPMIPLGRFGTPQEVADVVSFLCSDKATYITGQVIAVNGGAYR